MEVKKLNIVNKNVNFIYLFTKIDSFIRFRWRFGSRTGDPSSRNCTKTARFLWITAPTPATPWPATPRPPPQFGITAPRRARRSAGPRRRSRRTARRRPTWRIITTTGTSRARTCSIRAPCTTKSRSRAWELSINTDSLKRQMCCGGLSTRGTLQSKHGHGAGLPRAWFLVLDDPGCF